MILQWLEKIWPTETCINAVMSIAAPMLYARGVEGVKRIQERRDDLFKQAATKKSTKWNNALKCISKWPSAASGIGIISNREEWRRSPHDALVYLRNPRSSK